GTTSPPPRPPARRARSARSGSSTPPPRAEGPGNDEGEPPTGAPLVSRWASAAATRAQGGEGLVEDRRAVGVGATLLHVREVRLVGLVAHRRGRVLLVLPRRQ